MKKISTLLALVMLVANFLPICNVFAANEPTPVMSLYVNDYMHVFIGEGDQANFTATLGNIEEPYSNVTWSYDFGSGAETTQTPVNASNQSVLSFTYDELKDILIAGESYIMTASYTEGDLQLEESVRFGILGENPAVAFHEPNFIEEVSRNDAIHLKIKAYKGTRSSTLNVTWRCDSPSLLSSGYACPPNDQYEKDLAYKQPGEYRITATVTDDRNRSGSTSVLIRVLEDKPAVKFSEGRIQTSFIAGEDTVVNITATDRFGTINRIKWGCALGSDPVYTNYLDLTPPTSSSNLGIPIDLPETQVEGFACIFGAVDDDGEESDPLLAVFNTYIPSVDGPEDVDEPTEDNNSISSPDSGIVIKDNDSVSEDYNTPVLVVSLVSLISLVGIAIKKV